MVRRPIEKVFSLDRINQIYRAAKRLPPDRPFYRRVLDYLRINTVVSDEDLARIPAKGPVVVVANHPFGGIEGLVMLDLLLRVRPDARIMVNYLLERIPELRENFFFVNPFGGPQAARANVRTIKQCLEHLREGRLLGVFPAGAVSHLHLRQRVVTDPPWSPTIAGLIRRTGAVVVPVFFDGVNSKIFQLLGLIHPRLRTAMLPRQVWNKRGSDLRLFVGNPISRPTIDGFESDEDLTAYMRLRTYMLKSRGQTHLRARRAWIKPPKGRQFETIVAAEDPALLEQELAALPPESLLTSNAEFRVFSARARQIPRVLREIGRLREITFRRTGEGTGKCIDLDEFDNAYVHLFVWNHEQKQVVGAYRMGLTDEILERDGVGGLYTATLFEFRGGLLEKLGPALELGRSFIRPEYQKGYMPLLLLWKGIGQFILARPKYKTLIGPVSITNDYSTVSREVMVKFLQSQSAAPEMARLVRPRTPFRGATVRGVTRLELRNSQKVVKDLDDVSAIVSDVERDGKGVPILMKQYLKMGAKIIGFNLDPDFANALDGLMVCDLTRTDKRQLDRYMGKEGAARFLEFHGVKPPAKP